MYRKHNLALGPWAAQSGNSHFLNFMLIYEPQHGKETVFPNITVLWRLLPCAESTCKLFPKGFAPRFELFSICCVITSHVCMYVYIYKCVSVYIQIYLAERRGHNGGGRVTNVNVITN
jgi:hypothetical protein